ncbi:MAG: hypothetical protein AAF567_13825 [Actinomycetota bacterium]
MRIDRWLRVADHRRSLRQTWAPSRIRRIVRHRAVRVAACALALVVTAGLVQGERASLGEERAAWGRVEQVVQVIDFVGAGEALPRSALRIVERPAAMVPQGALGAVPSRGRAAVDLVPGELLLAGRVRGHAEGALPRDTVAVTIELLGTAALVEVGNLVDVWSVDAATQRSDRLVNAAVVLHRDDGSLSVAVPESAAADMAVAALRPLVVTLVS